MKILVCNPPFLDKFSRESRSPAVNKSGTLYYPMWLAYAVGYLEKQGHTVLFLDAPAQHLDRETVYNKAKAFDAELAVFGTSTPSIYNDVEVAAGLKAHLPEVFTCCVGVHVSAVPEETLTQAPAGLDAVAIHEYDETLNQLAQTLAANGPDTREQRLAQVKGLAFRTNDGRIVRNEDRPFMKDLDELPFVSYVYKKHLKDISPYFYGHSRHPLVVIVTGRGCPFHCTYCVIPQTLHGHTYRKRSVTNIVNEFVYIRDTFPDVKEIMIEDDTLTIDRTRCRALAQGLIEAKATTIPWSANSRADVDYETLKMMKKANCRLLCVGFESGDQTILDNIRKSISLDTIYRFRKAARRAGILIHGCFMVGNKGETDETLQKTLAFAKKLNPDTAQFYHIMVYPGTDAYRYYCEKQCVHTHNYREWITEEGLHSSVVSVPGMSSEKLVRFCDQARREFYLRPRYIAGKMVQIVTKPGESKRIFKAFGTFRRFLFRKN
jgi:radical SAM superfamily enzyme YgiQ (UPF0313 family)